MQRLPPIALALAAALAGCAVGPDFRPPQAPQSDRYTREAPAAQTAGAPIEGGEVQRFVRELDIPAQWWTLFRSPSLDALVLRALAANPDVQAAQAALRAAEEIYLAQRGALLPSAEAGASSSRQNVPAPLTSPLSSGASLYSLHTGQLTITYAPDVFGGVQRRVERAAALAESERFQLEATYLTLAANVVAAAIEEASLRAQIAALEEVAVVEREQVRLMQRQFELGEIARSNVTAQRSLLAQTEAALVPLRKQLALKRNLLTALAGRLPQDEVEEKFAFAEIQLPVELPVSLPSSLVRQRPDVRAAEARLHAASAEIGVATANMLPQLRLTADAGAVATSLLSGGAGFWMLAAGVTQPVFQGGALEHRKLAAEAAYDEAFARYRSTVVGAFRGVADALRALQFDAEALKSALDARTLADENLRSARRERAAGDISTLALLGAEQVYRQTVIAVIQVQASRYADTAALFQALGGGWWNRAPRQAP